MRRVVRSAPILRVLVAGLLGLVGPGGQPARALDIDHPSVGPDPRAPQGPLVSDVGPDHFALNVGSRDGTPRAASLLVYDAATRPTPTTPPLQLRESAPAAWHLLSVTGLVPGHRYRYRLLIEDHADLDGEVSTAPAPDSPSPLLFAVFGDERGAGELAVAAGASALVRSVVSEAPDLVIGTGDLVSEGGRPGDWQSLLLSHGPMFAQLPYFPALGNHELIGDPDGTAWRRLFPRARSGHYAVRYGAALLLFLDGNRPGDSAQTRFLETELSRAAADPAVRARLVVMHQPPLSASLHCGSARYMAEWVALWERFHVDAVLAGHDHTYQRLERGGVAYFVSGGGGAPLYPLGSCGEPDEPALQRYESAHHYLLVRITPRPQGGAAITVRAQAPSGPVLDEVSLPLPRTSAPPLDAQRLEPGQRPAHRLHRGYLLYAARRVGPTLLLFVAALIVSALAWRLARRR